MTTMIADPPRKTTMGVGFDANRDHRSNPQAWKQAIGTKPIAARLALLPDPKPRWDRMGISAGSQIAILIFLLLIPMIFPEQMKTALNLRPRTDAAGYVDPGRAGATDPAAAQGQGEGTAGGKAGSAGAGEIKSEAAARIFDGQGRAAEGAHHRCKAGGAESYFRPSESGYADESAKASERGREGGKPWVRQRRAGDGGCTRE